MIEWYNLLVECAAEVKGTTDGLERLESIDLGKHGVVCDLEATSDGNKLWHGDVGKLVAVDERELLANVGQVGRDEALEIALVNAHRSIDGRKGRDRDAVAISESRVVCPHEVGELDVESTVGEEGQSVRDIAQLHGNSGESVVVCNIDGVGDLKINAVERSQHGVVNGELVDLRNTGGERETLKGGESHPVDGVDLLELWEVQAGKDGKAFQIESIRNLHHAVGCQGCQASDVLRNQAALKSSNASKVNVVGGLGRDGDVASVGCAASKGGGISAVLDGFGAGALCCESVSPYDSK